MLEIISTAETSIRTLVPDTDNTGVGRFILLYDRLLEAQYKNSSVEIFLRVNFLILGGNRNEI